MDELHWYINWKDNDITATTQFGLYKIRPVDGYYVLSVPESLRMENQDVKHFDYKSRAKEYANKHYKNLLYPENEASDQKRDFGNTISASDVLNNMITTDPSYNQLKKERDAARQTIIDAWNAFSPDHKIVEEWDDVNYVIEIGLGDLPEQIKALTEQRNSAEEKLQKIQSLSVID